MAGNTRGKLKEEFQGMHKNLDWLVYHCQRALVLIADHKPELSDAVRAIYEVSKSLDEQLMGIYNKL